MTYATEAELEAIMMVSTSYFGAATPITTTMVTAILAQYSAMLDGLCGKSEGSFGSDTTCPEWVKQAVLAAASARIEAALANKDFTQEDAERLMNKWINIKPADTTPSFYTKTPSRAGSRDGTWVDD